MQDFTNIIANFGFPVAVAAFLLFSFQRDVRNLIFKVEKLIDKVDDVLSRLDK